MKINKHMTNYSILILLFAVTYIIYSNYEYPNYVRDAINSVSSKMSNSYGITECDASEDKESRWHLDCRPESGTDNLKFIVYSYKISPYKVPGSFYLVADNDAAKNGAKLNFDEGILRYLMINTGNS